MTILRRSPSAALTTLRTRASAELLALTVAAAGSTALVATVDPNQPGHYPTCPILLVSGFWCPGCGGLRAAYDLLHGDVADALARNPLIFVAVPVVLMFLTNLTARALGIKHVTVQQVRPWMLYSVLVALLVYGVLRNLPGWTFLSPA